MTFFLWGASAMASAVAALLFLRFWTRTRERLFVWFATAFAILCLNWIGLATNPYTREARSAVYLLRLLAFAVILIALIDENRRKR